MTLLSKFSTAKLGLKITVLCTTTTICAFSLYLLFKKKFDPYEEDRLAKAAMQSQYTRIRIKVEQRKCGHIIGKDGMAIKAIAKETGVQLHFVDEQDESKTERTLEICGLRNKVIKAELRIQEILKSIPDIKKKIIHVPKKSVGCIIGKGGATILRMKQATSCKISIQKIPVESKFNEIELVGTEEQIDNAKRLIFDEVQEDSTRRFRQMPKETVKKYMKVEDMIPTEIPYRKVFISAIDNPGHFWCQFLDKDDGLTLEDINTKISESLSKDDGELPCLAIGDMVAGRFEFDDKWYRARVNDIADNKIDLYFVDYGDSEWVRFPEDVRKLPKAVENCEYQAVECCLANVIPIDEWTDEASQFFEELTACAKWQPRYLVEYKQKSEDGYKLVSLFDSLEGQPKCLENYLVQRNYAIFKDR
ncbi:unnamed protein product [Dimorphilus gyrociliatus]|uniref:Tudor domain-containing protein n=1 Tax=Dimorphilus gyrociliatus TaxID=2664684 RepID=A0A7I8VXE8_9ANNE|nr:unnamed protein product [Dimorphilus gyrociliatus]